jgi:hypothetical protein
MTAVVYNNAQFEQASYHLHVQLLDLRISPS